MPDSTPDRVPEDNHLPDECKVITDRLDELEDEESHLTVDEITENLGIDLE